jgi:hypothetical protein
MAWMFLMLAEFQNNFNLNATDGRARHSVRAVLARLNVSLHSQRAEDCPPYPREGGGGAGFGLITRTARNTVLIMTSRNKVSLFFLTGIVVSGATLAILSNAFSYQSGMSAVSVSPDETDTLVYLLLFLYFIVSAIGIYVCDTKKTLRLIASISHLALLGLFILIGKVNFQEGSTSGLSDLFVAYFVVLLFFSPWLGAWVWLLKKYSPENEP